MKEALAKSPDDPDILYYLGRAGAALANQSQDKLLSEFPRSARGHQTLGQNYYADRIFSEAEKGYGQCIALRPDLPALHLELGEVYAGTSDWPKAEEQFRAETKLQPGNAEAAFRLGSALLQEGRMKDASEELQRSDSPRPDMPETLYALGRALATRARRRLGKVRLVE